MRLFSYMIYFAAFPPPFFPPLWFQIQGCATAECITPKGKAFYPGHSLCSQLVLQYAGHYILSHRPHSPCRPSQLYHVGERRSPSVVVLFQHHGRIPRNSGEGGRTCGCSAPSGDRTYDVCA